MASEHQEDISGIETLLRRRFQRTPQSDLTINNGEREGHESEEREGFRSGFAQWNTSDFTPCSQTCAGGIQRRAVFCEQVFIVMINDQWLCCYEFFKLCILHINEKRSIFTIKDTEKDRP